MFFLCGALWDERGDECMVTVKDLSVLGQQKACFGVTTGSVGIVH